MPVWLSESEYRILSAACDRMIPPSENGPGATAAGVPDYIDGLLGAFLVRPAEDLGRRTDLGSPWR